MGAVRYDTADYSPASLTWRSAVKAKVKDQERIKGQAHIMGTLAGCCQRLFTQMPQYMRLSPLFVSFICLWLFARPNCPNVHNRFVSSERVNVSNV